LLETKDIFGEDNPNPEGYSVPTLEKDRMSVVAYIDTTVAWKLGQSMHLAINKNDVLEPLNFGYGVLFAPANFDQTAHYKFGATRTLINPWIFRMLDGKIGVVAQSIESELQNDQEINVAASLGKLLFWTTLDLITYEFKGLITVAEGEKITKPQVSFDNGLYCMTWEGENGEIRESYSTDFHAFTKAAKSSKVHKKFTQMIRGGVISCIFSVTEQEERYLFKKLGEVRNVGVKPMQDITVQSGGAIDFVSLPKLTAIYSDGSTADKAVCWDKETFDHINFNQPGTYPISGKIDIKEYAWPLINNRADPDIIYYQGRYYFIATDESLQERLYIRVADTLAGLETASDHLILGRNHAGDMSGLFWAPELHIINGKLHILFAASTESTPADWWKHVQCRVMELKGSNPTRASDWGEAQRILMQDGSTPLYDHSGITLDMTYFEVNGKHYYMWSQREIAGGIDSANLLKQWSENSKRYGTAKDTVLRPLCSSEGERIGQSKITINTDSYRLERELKRIY